MSPDIINGLFELFGGILIWLNVREIRRDKMVAGISWLPTGFFALWGIWNLWFYAAIDAWFSWFGGLSIVVANSVWWYYMLKYRNNHDRTSSS